MIKLARYLTGILPLYTEADIEDTFSPRVEAALNCGFLLHGSPSLTFNTASGYLKAGQGIEAKIIGDENYEAVGFVSMKDLSLLDRSKGIQYRLVAGQDNSAYCAEIERAVNERWDIFGSASMASMGDIDVVAHALVRGYEHTALHQGHVVSSAKLTP